MNIPSSATRLLRPTRIAARSVTRLTTLVLVALLAALAGAQNLPMAGDDEHLWLVDDSIGPEAQAVLHRSVADDPGVLRQAYALDDRLMPGGIAADGGEVWLIAADRRLRVILAERSAIDGQWVYSSHTERRLPRGLALRAFTVVEGAPWLLVRVESAQTLRDLDRPDGAADEDGLSIDDELMAIALGLPPTTPAPSHEAPSVQQPPTPDLPEQPEAAAPPTSGPGAKPEPVSEDRLITLDRGRWRSVALPDGWRAPRLARLAVWSEHDERPTLFAAADAGRPDLWRAYRWADEAWQDHEFELAESEPPAIVVVDRQPIAVQAVASEEGPFQLRFSALRRGETQPIGVMFLESRPPVNWGAAAMGLRITVVASSMQRSLEGQLDDSGRQFIMRTLGVDGQQDDETLTLRVEPPPPMLSQPDYVVMVSVLIVSTVLMFLFWRRDPRANRLILPDGYQLADLPRRGIAGAIDLAPAVIASLVVFGVSPSELLLHWPGQPTAGSWAAMQPGLLAIAVFLVHTTLGEAFTGRSLGKWVMGLSIRSLTGKRASLSQAVVRGVLKTLDLIAWLLLLLPVIGPFRQRLGDLVARTVVVMPQPEEPEEEEEDESDEDEL